MDSLASFWSRLEDTIHPDDRDMFAAHPGHGFNLDYPPPAFIGDIINAPVIILDNNGGYDPALTPGEFARPGAAERYRRQLANPEPLDPDRHVVSPYYLQRNYTRWLISGEAALVNALAYRSVDSNAPLVKKLNRILASAIYHRKWLSEVLVPLARKGERFVVVHRRGLWQKEPMEALRELEPRNAVFSEFPHWRKPDLSECECKAAQDFLNSR